MMNINYSCRSSLPAFQPLSQAPCLSVATPLLHVLINQVYPHCETSQSANTFYGIWPTLCATQSHPLSIVYIDVTYFLSVGDHKPLTCVLIMCTILVCAKSLPHQLANFHMHIHTLTLYSFSH